MKDTKQGVSVCGIGLIFYTIYREVVNLECVDKTELVMLVLCI